MSQAQDADSGGARALLDPEESRADKKAQARNDARIEKAAEAVNRGNPEKARTLLSRVLEDGRLSGPARLAVWSLLQKTGDEERAGRVRDGLIAAVEQAVAANPEDEHVLLQACNLYMKLGEREKTLESALRLIELCPQRIDHGMPLINLMLTRGEPDRLVEHWQPILEAVSDDMQHVAVSCLVRGLGHFGYRDHALAVLDRVTPATPRTAAECAKLRERLNDTQSDRVRLDEAIADFDVFADYYDNNLAKIGNRGPQLIGEMVALVGWKPEADRDILDAGCGTGLCAPFLRPYARTLHGCDVSIGMLEKAKARNIYDLLTRTDIGTPATYPDATFTDAVSADVLVYFGDLVPPLRNLASVLRPGGWIIFTVEDATEQSPPRGWELYSAGRFRHMPDYVREVLPRAGFTRPRHELRSPLRNEFGLPVAGLCVAAQRLAFPL
jgi:predicted TPR repeat methyltransferase